VGIDPHCRKAAEPRSRASQIPRPARLAATARCTTKMVALLEAPEAFGKLALAVLAAQQT
jgi:hypothetical protein